jgi:uncharacterized protein YbjT (DUF2867 family)
VTKSSPQILKSHSVKNKIMSKTAIIIGATGLTGTALLNQLLEHPAYSQVTILVRREMPLQHSKLKQVLFDFDAPNASLIQGDDLFCAMGTTLAKAGSKEAQYKIDCTYPAEIGRLAKANGVKRYLLVSSVGADANSSGFYLKTKGELEQKIQALGFERFVAARPSFLLGNRAEFRLGERIGIVMIKAFSSLLVGGLHKYKGIAVTDLASALIRMANDGKVGVDFPEFDALMGART